MKSGREQVEIIALYEELGSYRAVASILGCDHKTVKRYVEQAGARGQLAPVRQRARITDGFADLIRERVEMTRAKITSKSLHRTLRAAGYEGSARSLRRALAAERNAYRARMAAEGRVFRPWVSAPGEWLLCDWGSAGEVATAAGPRPLSFFCSVLGYSRQRQITFGACERFPALAIGLASNLEQIGGVPQKVLFDNPRTVCVGEVAGAHVLNPDLVRLAAHYRFSPRTTEYYDPESKGKVEATVRFAKTDLIPAEGFGSLDEANEAGVEWCRRVNSEVHSETKRSPAELAEREREVLRALPPERPPLACGEQRKVDKLATIRFASARYSVPHRLVGRSVEALATDRELIVKGRLRGKQPKLTARQEAYLVLLHRTGGHDHRRARRVLQRRALDGLSGAGSSQAGGDRARRRPDGLLHLSCAGPANSESGGPGCPESRALPSGTSSSCPSARRSRSPVASRRPFLRRRRLRSRKRPCPLRRR
jgi:transposase